MVRRHGNSGFSLVEMMLAVGILAIVIVLNMQIVEEISQTQASLMKKLTAEENIMHAISSLKRNMAMAVNLTRVAGPSVNGATMDRNQGQVAPYNLNGWVPTNGPGQIDAIAFFLRENMTSGSVATMAAAPAPTPAAITQRYPVTTIFFQRPTLNRYGVLYIDVVGDPASGTLRPRDNAEKVPYIVDFEILEIFSQPFQEVLNGGAGYAMDADLNSPPREMVSAVTIKVTQRSYFGTTAQSVYRWCPPAFMGLPACATTTPYKDSTKMVTIAIRNNVLGRSFTQRGAGPSTLVGGSVNSPATPYYSRRDDSIYYLKSMLPIGVLSR